MKRFTDIIHETVKTNLTKDSLIDYLNKFKKKLPISIQQLLKEFYQYNIVNASLVDKIKSATSKDIQKISGDEGIPQDELIKIQNLLREAKDNIKLLPMNMTPGVFDAMMNGKLDTDDIMLDLSTARGRNNAAKQYMPIVYKIVNQWVGKCSLSKTDLISVALEGLTAAINEWTPEPNKDGKVVPFKTMVGYRVKYYISDEVSKSHSVSGGNQYFNKKNGTGLLYATSLDRFIDGEDLDQSKLASLGVEDVINIGDGTQWKDFYKLLEKTFPERTCNVFYRYFGVNGFKKEKSKDIAKSLGLSEGAIRNNFINKILKWINDNKQVKNILKDLQDIHTESLMCQLYDFGRESIIEHLLNDDVYILLEEIIPWRNKSGFDKAYVNAKKYLSSDEIKTIEYLLNGDFRTLDDNLKKESDIIKKFVMLMYPKLNVGILSDVSLIDKMSELQEIYKK